MKISKAQSLAAPTSLDEVTKKWGPCPDDEAAGGGISTVPKNDPARVLDKAESQDR